MRPVSPIISVLVALVVTPASGFDLPIFAQGGWQWQETIDPITDEVHRSATITTTRLDLAGSKVNAAGVMVSCTSGRPSISFLWTVKVVGTENWELEYRFDGQPGRRLSAKFINRSQLSGTSLGELRRFLAEAAVSDRLLVRVSSFTYGATGATFGTRGGKEMVARFLTACPVAASR